MFTPCKVVGEKYPTLSIFQEVYNFYPALAHIIVLYANASIHSATAGSMSLFYPTFLIGLMMLKTDYVVFSVW